MPWSKSNPFQGVKNQTTGVQSTFHSTANAVLRDGGSEVQAIRAGWASVKKKYKKRGGKWVPKYLAQGIIDKKREGGQPEAKEVDITALPKEAFILNRSSKPENWRYPYRFLDKAGKLKVHAELLENSFQQARTDKASKSTVGRLQKYRRRLGMIESRPTQGETMIATRRTSREGTMAVALDKALSEKRAEEKVLILAAEKRARSCGIAVKAVAKNLHVPEGREALDLWADPVNFKGHLGTPKDLKLSELSFRKGALGSYSLDEKKILWNRIVLAKAAAELPHVYDSLTSPFDAHLSGEAEKYAKTCVEEIEVDEEFEITFPFVTDKNGKIQTFEKKVGGKTVLLLKGEATNTEIDKEDEYVTENFLKKIKAAAEQTRLPAFYEHRRDIEHTIGYVDPEELEIAKSGGIVRLLVGIVAEDPEKNIYVKQILEKTEHGTPLGLSIGGKLIRVKRSYDEDLGRPVNSLGDGNVWEISATALPAIFGQPLEVIAKALSGVGKIDINDIKKLKETLNEMMEARDIQNRCHDLWWLMWDKFREIKDDPEMDVADKKDDLKELVDDFIGEFNTMIKELISDFVKHYNLNLRKEVK